MPSPLAAKLLYSHERPLPFDKEREEPASEPTREDIEKDFEVFNRTNTKDPPVSTYRKLVAAQDSTSQEAVDIPDAMVLKKKMPDLLALLSTHAGGNAPMVSIVPRPPTPVLSHTFVVAAFEKKRKRGKQIKSSEEVEIPQPTQ